MANEQIMLTEAVAKKWKPILENKNVPTIKDPYRRKVTTILLENQSQILKENVPMNQTGNIQNWDPVLISLVRRAMPNLIAYDICGVQPMTAPTGLIFALTSHVTRATQNSATETMFQRVTTQASGSAADDAGAFQNEPDPADYPTPAAGHRDTITSGVGGVVAGDPFLAANMPIDDPVFQDPIFGAFGTQFGEELGNGTADRHFNEMSIKIERTSVAARTRALKAEYTTEMAQDLKAVHGLDAETELANILSAEILAEINREVVETIYRVALLGAGTGTTTAGVFDLNFDSNGRWTAERFKGLYFQIEKECNAIAKATRRGKGNFIIVSSDVASALAMAGILDQNGLNPSLTVDDTGNTFAGTLPGGVKVFVDPYTLVGVDFCAVGYKGPSPWDAGLFYCPYVPLQMVRAVGEDSFQPKIGFKTRYGLVSNPFVKDDGGINPDAEQLTPRVNQYYSIFRIDNLT